MTVDPSSTFVLIPGAGGSAFYWYRLVAELDRRGRASVAVELPAGDEDAGLPEYAAAVLDAIDGIDDTDRRRRPVDGRVHRTAGVHAATRPRCW